MVGRRVTRYETARVVAATPEWAVEAARRAGIFGHPSEETEYDVFDAPTADVVVLDGRRAPSA